MTLSFVPPFPRVGNNARPASLHPSPDRINHPAPLLLLADDAQLGQGGDELGGRGVGGQQCDGAGGGGEDGDQEDFAGHVNNLSFFAQRVCVNAGVGSSPALRNSLRSES